MPRSRKTTSATTTGRGRPRSNDSGVSQADLVRMAKKGYGHSEAARELGVEVSAFSSMAYSKALVEAGEYEVVPSKQRNAKTIRDLYENDGLRWELIAAMFETSVADVKDIAGGPEEIADWTRATKGAAENGGNGGNGGSSRGTSKKTTAASSKTRSVKRTSARSKKESAASATTTRRARTRAQRRAQQSGNPS